MAIAFGWSVNGSGADHAINNGSVCGKKRPATLQQGAVHPENKQPHTNRLQNRPMKDRPMAAGMSLFFCAPPPASPARDTNRPKRLKSLHFGRLVSIH